MSTHFIGTTFPSSSDWHVDENNLIKNIHNQIDLNFPQGQNLFINTTWFGPQFNNEQWQRYQEIKAQTHFDRVFLLAAADPVFLNPDQINQIKEETSAELYLLGHFDSPYYFNFYTQVLPRYFVKYTESQLLMTDPKLVYINYNRKPRDHRCALVNKLIDQNLLKYGIVTLGQQNHVYTQHVVPLAHLSLEETPEDAVGNWGMDMSFGIPHDIHSLGNLDHWRQHFLNVVGETEFFPWDNMFISEKTWKPILGLRPFLINGQTKIYRYLREHGFKTFNHYWPEIDVETDNEFEVHNGIVSVIKHLSNLSSSEIADMYSSMLPDLLHNQQHFYAYAAAQQRKIESLFK